METEEVKIQVPKAIMNFLRSLSVDPSEHFSEAAVRVFKADYDVFHSDPEIFIDVDGLARKAGLDEILREKVQ